MSGVENNSNFFINLGNTGKKIDLNSILNSNIASNDINKSVFDKFDIDKNGKLDAGELQLLKDFVGQAAGDDKILSEEEVIKSGWFGSTKSDVNKAYEGLYNLYSQVSDSSETSSTSTEQVQTTGAESVETSDNTAKEETSTHNYKVNYQDTWYGIVQAKYGITSHKQTMEIIRQLKQQNNVDPKATNMPSEITLPANVTLKDGTNVSLADINAEVDKSHFGYRTTSETGRYTVTQNGQTKYYAADGTELKQSYYEAKEAPEDKRQMAESGSGRYSYTASDGETWYFAADGTAITKEYYEKRESEYTAVGTQSETVANARAAFEQQVASDGWAGKTADAVSALWGSENRAVKVEADLQAYEKQVEELRQAQSQGSAAFDAKFKEIYGVEYNPENIAAYEANPTEENYKKAYGDKNDIHKRVTEYNISQQKGASAVKTTVVVAASTAAAVATGGASLAATAAVVGGTTAATRAVAEVTDLATNDIDGDVAENAGDIAKQATVEGVISGVTAGALKGVGNYLGKAKAPTSTETGLVHVSQDATSTAQGGLVKSATQTSTGSATGSTAGNAAGSAGAKTAGSTAGNATGKTASSSAGSAAGNTASKANVEFVRTAAKKVSSNGGVNNLTPVEKEYLSKAFGKSVDEISTLSKSEFRQLAVKFHPDKNPGQEEFYHEMFVILSHLRTAA